MMSDESFPTVGILGAGQLGRMTAYSALQMGLSVRLLTPHPTGSMKGVGEATVDDWTKPEVLRSFAEKCSVVTVENEWAPVDTLADVLPKQTELWPKPDTLQVIRHKGVQNDTLREAGLPLPDYRRCETVEEAQAAAETFGYPVALKKYTRAYDGYGNAFAETPEDIKTAWPDLADEDGLLVEEKVNFQQELSALVARRPDGEYVVYPIAFTEQRDHRCHAVLVPASLPDGVVQQAQNVAVSAIETVGGVGLNAVELFYDLEKGILINEIAPRPHNTGHYSIEGSYTSQFENHLRAVLDWPLGNPSLRAPAAAMVNVLGHRNGSPQPKGLEQALTVPNVSVHIYGKSEVRPNRKMGHVTTTGKDTELLRKRAEEAASYIKL